VRLARLLALNEHQKAVSEITHDGEEDPYVRLEGLCYLVSLGQVGARAAFGPVLCETDDQTRLEAVIALSEVATDDATDILGEVLSSAHLPGFMRTAAGWSLGKIGGRRAQQLLVGAFADLSQAVREEALESVVALGEQAVQVLLQGLKGNDEDVAAGCAEALRQWEVLPDGVVEELVADLAEGRCDVVPSRWIVWLLGHLPVDPLAPSIAGLQRDRPDLYYALSVLWSFVRSWIARRWELRPSPVRRVEEGSDAV
jgi:HEAT repeat protein